MTKSNQPKTISKEEIINKIKQMVQLTLNVKRSIMIDIDEFKKNNSKIEVKKYYPNSTHQKRLNNFENQLLSTEEYKKMQLSFNQLLVFKNISIENQQNKTKFTHQIQLQEQQIKSCLDSLELLKKKINNIIATDPNDSNSKHYCLKYFNSIKQCFNDYATKLVEVRKLIQQIQLNQKQSPARLIKRDVCEVQNDKDRILVVREDVKQKKQSYKLQNKNNEQKKDTIKRIRQILQITLNAKKKRGLDRIDEFRKNNLRIKVKKDYANQMKLSYLGNNLLSTKEYNKILLQFNQLLVFKNISIENQQNIKNLIPQIQLEEQQIKSCLNLLELLQNQINTRLAYYEDSNSKYHCLKYFNSIKQCLNYYAFDLVEVKSLIQLMLQNQKQIPIRLTKRDVCEVQDYEDKILVVREDVRQKKKSFYNNQLKEQSAQKVDLKSNKRINNQYKVSSQKLKINQIQQIKEQQSQKQRHIIQKSIIPTQDKPKQVQHHQFKDQWKEQQDLLIRKMNQLTGKVQQLNKNGTQSQSVKQFQWNKSLQRLINELKKVSLQIMNNTLELNSTHQLNQNLKDQNEILAKLKQQIISLEAVKRQKQENINSLKCNQQQMQKEFFTNFKQNMNSNGQVGMEVKQLETALKLEKQKNATLLTELELHKQKIRQMQKLQTNFRLEGQKKAIQIENTNNQQSLLKEKLKQAQDLIKSKQITYNSQVQRLKAQTKQNQQKIRQLSSLVEISKHKIQSKQSQLNQQKQKNTNLQNRIELLVRVESEKQVIASKLQDLTHRYEEKDRELLQMKNKLITVQNQRQARQIDYNNRLERLQTNILKQQKTFQQLQTSLILKELNNLTVQKAQQITKINKEVEQKLLDMQRDCNGKINSKINEIDTHRKNLQDTQNKYKQNEILWKQNEQSLKRHIQTLKKQIKQKSVKNEGQLSKINELQKIIHDKYNQIDQLFEKIQIGQSKSRRLLEQLQLYKKNLKKSQQIQKQRQKQKQCLDEQLNKKNQECENNLKVKQQQLSQYQIKLSSKSKKINELQMQVNNLRQKKPLQNNLQQGKSQYNSDKDSLNDQIAMLKRQLEQKQSDINNANKQLLEIKNVLAKIFEILETKFNMKQLQISNVVDEIKNITINEVKLHKGEFQQ